MSFTFAKLLLFGDCNLVKRFFYGIVVYFQDDEAEEQPLKKSPNADTHLMFQELEGTGTV